MMLDVFYTVDVEVWCDGWSDLDARFPDAFQRHIYGRTARGDYGLPLQLRMLNDAGLTGAFFVEPLFSTRFGPGPLEEIVALLSEGRQDIQLHLHTEWLDEAPVPLLADCRRKRQFLKDFSLDEQRTLLDAGTKLLEAAGADRPVAFRAGGFGFNTNTLTALADTGLTFDSSYNACMFGLESGVMPGTVLVEPLMSHGIVEYPVTVFLDGLGRLRPVQITACSSLEMESVLWRALEAGRQSVVIVSHSFELLDQSRTRPDRIATRRLDRLCRFLDAHRDVFRVRSFADLDPTTTGAQPAPLAVPAWATVRRLAEQTIRRFIA